MQHRGKKDLQLHAKVRIFLSRYKFKQLELLAYNPQTNSKQKTKVYVADIQIESIFGFAKKFGVMVEKEDLYLPVVDRASFKLAVDFLLENFRFIAEHNGINLRGELRFTQKAKYARSTLTATICWKTSLRPILVFGDRQTTAPE